MNITVQNTKATELEVGDVLSHADGSHARSITSITPTPAGGFVDVAFNEGDNMLLRINAQRFPYTVTTVYRRLAW